MSSPVATKIIRHCNKYIKIQKQSSFLAGLRLRDLKKLGLWLRTWARIQTTGTPTPHAGCHCAIVVSHKAQPSSATVKCAARFGNPPEPNLWATNGARFYRLEISKSTNTVGVNTVCASSFSIHELTEWRDATVFMRSIWRQYWKNSPMREWRTTLHKWRFCQVQSHVTQKLGQISISRPEQI